MGKVFACAAAQNLGAFSLNQQVHDMLEILTYSAGLYCAVLHRTWLCALVHAMATYERSNMPF